MDEKTEAGPLTKAIRAFLTRHRAELLFALFFLALTVLLFRGYFVRVNPLGTDTMGLPFIIDASEPGNFFSTWISFSGLGFPDYPLPSYQLVYMITTALGSSPLDIAKFLLPFSFWLAGVVMFFVVRRLTANNIASVAAALIFSFNQVILSQVIDGHYYFVLGSALFPLVFLIFYCLWSGRGTKYFFLVPVVLVVFGTLAPPNIVLIASLFLGLFAVAKFVIHPFPARRLATTMGFVALIMLFLGLSVVLANNIPTYSTSYPIEEAMRWSSPTLMDGLTVKSSENSFFYGNTTADWVQPAFLTPVADVLAFAVPILAFSSLLLKGQRRHALPFAIVALIFIFLSKGPYDPLSGAFEWAFSYVPLMDTIRVYSRFSLFTSFAYGMMVAYLIVGMAANRSALTMPLRRANLLRHKGAVGAVIVAALGTCLVVQSGVIFTGAIDAFNMPNEYQQPFEWVGEQEGDFRVLNLPYMADYHNGPSLYGYPNTTTIDPGIYSLLYTGKDTAYGSSTSDYWSYFKYAMDERSLGYRDIASIMGNTATVRYIVVQPHTSVEEKNVFLSMKGLVPVATMDGGGMVLENQNWSPRVTAYGHFSMVTGGRDMLTKLSGMGLYDPHEEGLVFLSQLSPSEIDQLLNRSDHIYLDNGDLTLLFMDMAQWAPGRSVMLHTLAASHTIDHTTHWVQDKGPMKAGLTLQPSLSTTGPNSISVRLEDSGEGPQEIYLKIVRGPNAGNVSISAPGQPEQTFDAYHSVNQTEWVKFLFNDLSGPITISNRGDGSALLERLVVASPAEMDAQRQKVMGSLSEHADKLVYVYTETSFGEAERSIGPEGYGVAPTIDGGTLTITAGDLLSSESKVLVKKLNESDVTSIRVQGEQMTAVNSSMDGEVFDLGRLTGGETIEVLTTGIYGLAVFASDWSEEPSPSVNVKYERPNYSVYKVETAGDGPFLLRISEGYNTWWDYRADGVPAIHIPINSIVNGYLVNEDGPAVIEYQAKTTYFAILGTTAVVITVATSLIVFSRFKLRKKGANG